MYRMGVKTRKNIPLRRRIEHGGKTRRQHSGGAVLGEGAHGKTYDAGCGNGESLCDLLERKSPSQVTLYTPTGKYELAKDDITTWIDWVRGLRNVIAKTFKPGHGFGQKSLQSKLDEELEANNRIIKAYGKKASEFLTIAPVVGFRSYEITGAVVEFASGEPLYIVFGHKCVNKFTVEPTALVRDVLESLQVLQIANMAHNDIKLDNVVLCGEKYKLIDWGNATVMKYSIKTQGSPFTTSPLRWYTLGKPALASKLWMEGRALVGKRNILLKPLFLEQITRIKTQFDAVLLAEKDREALYKKYAHSFDVFAVGMMLLYTVYDQGLDYEKYKPLIEKLTNLLEPLDAAAALRSI